MSNETFASVGKAQSEVAVLGAGSWGTALATLLGANGHSVRLWSCEEDVIRALDLQGENTRYLPGVAMPSSVQPTTDLAAAIRGAQFVVFAVPCSAMREVATAAAIGIAPGAVIVSAAKGLEEKTDLRMTQTLGQVLPWTEGHAVALSGPNLAVEVGRGVPTASVAASSDQEAARAVQALFIGMSTFRVYTGRDVVGVELGGAIKNVIAIGAGICDGLGYGDNTKAALMTRGLAEAIRIGTALGAETTTFLGLSGVGDLIATGASRLSRNYRVGLGLGLGRSLDAILADLGQVAEGVPTTRVLAGVAAERGVDAPICAGLNSVLFAGRGAPEVIRELMLRPPKAEYGDAE